MLSVSNGNGRLHSQIILTQMARPHCNCNESTATAHSGLIFPAPLPIPWTRFRTARAKLSWSMLRGELGKWKRPRRRLFLIVWWAGIFERQRRNILFHLTFRNVLRSTEVPLRQIWLYYPAYVLPIIIIRSMTCLWNDTAPVSYTHLTLPTICSV